jgi:signal transduction histidine kinase
MFLPFKQLGNDRTGMGLGLAISRRAVEENGGLLSVRDAPGKGCVFILDLPRLAPDPPNGRKHA